ncbi:immunity 8 family protein [Paenibacillus sp. AK002]
MIKPVLVSFTVISEEWGDDIENFAVEIQLDIGPYNSEGADTFSFRVVSPKKLEQYLDGNSVEFGRGIFIMKDYNIKNIQSEVKRLIENCQGNSWREVALLLSRYFHWEYEE